MNIEEARRRCENEIKSAETILQRYKDSACMPTISELALIGLESIVASLGLVWLDRLEAEDGAPINVQVHTSPSSGDTDNVQAVPVAYGTPETTA